MISLGRPGAAWCQAMRACATRASLGLEIAAAAIGHCACYKAIHARLVAELPIGAGTLYVISLAVAIAGLACRRPPGKSRLLLFALFLFTLALIFFPASLPAVLHGG
jgi:hypothetical protein